MSKDEPHLASTYKMIGCAFPDGIDEWAYLPLLHILYDHMSDRTLASVVADMSGRDYARVLNDVYRVAADRPPPRRDEVLARLRQHGYDAWTSEE
jgi:hypothetical protein